MSAGRRRGGPQEIPRPPQWRPGRPAPWWGADVGALGPGQVRQVMAARGPAVPSPVEERGARASAVLAPLYEHAGELHVILTRRSPHLRRHRGEVSFPGGRHEPGDPSLVHTALRETEEETGLPATAVEVVGELDHLTTVSSNAFIVPYVGLVEARPEALAPEPTEVDDILHVPLAELLLPEVFREERWGPEGLDRPIYFFELHGDTVWGATAAMLRQLLALLTGTDPGSGVDVDPARHAPPHWNVADPDSVV